MAPSENDGFPAATASDLHTSCTPALREMQRALLRSKVPQALLQNSAILASNVCRLLQEWTCQKMAQDPYTTKA